MARGSNEHRMVFDIRGRRRHVVKVVYAILAVLMAASLFLVTGALNVGSIFGGNTSGESATSSLEKEAARIERRLAKSPEDEDILASLTRTRINTANTMIAGVETEGESVSQGSIEEIQQELAQVSEDWSNYLEAAKEPNPGLAIQVAPALFQAARLASSNAEAVEKIKTATAAQKILTEARPNLNSWSTLAIYALYAQEFKVAEHAKEEATKLTTSKFAREQFENEIEKTEKAAKELGKAVKAEETAQTKSAGKESLENPLQGLGGSTLGGG